MLKAPIIAIDCPLEFGSSIFIPGFSHTLEGACHMLKEVSSMYTMSIEGFSMMSLQISMLNCCCYWQSSCCLSFLER